ncbi:hypothetical protein H0H87_010930 [Tephrocybe sp. NHM501043]|nr:hypothetical protein H0H87_010930 [Tephrocybe sp. NHM501043]
MSSTNAPEFDRLINNRKLEFCTSPMRHRRSHRRVHIMPLVITDGACSNNGQSGARSGLGIALGYLEEFCFGIPIDETIDGKAPRTNQRAELLAAMHGLKTLQATHNLDSEPGLTGIQLERHEGNDPRKFAIVTDSEYVVKGMTEWFPTWRRNCWRTSQGKRPGNLDLFVELDKLITAIENTGIVVGFWQVPREYTAVADKLAREASRRALYSLT